MTPWGRALRDYTNSLRAAGHSSGTVKLHAYWLGRLAEEVPDPWAATTEDLQEFLSVETWKPETRKSARTAVRGFYQWALDAGRIRKDPSARLRPVRVPPGVPRPAPEKVLRAALAAADERMALMLRLAAFGGLRAAEMARVHSDDLVGDVLRVHGKGGRTREVPITSPDLLARLRAVDDWAFPNGLGSHMTPGHVTKLVSQALPPGWTAHTLRHRMASQAYAGSRDLLAVGGLLGHARPETTQRYVRMPDDALRAAVAHVDHLATLLEHLASLGRREGGGPLRAWEPIATPCPPWCELAEGHGYTYEGELVREHARDFGEGSFCASVLVRGEAPIEDGPEVLDQPRVTVWVDEPGELSPDETRRLAGYLVAAADAADAVAEATARA